MIFDILKNRRIISLQYVKAEGSQQFSGLSSAFQNTFHKADPHFGRMCFENKLFPAELFEERMKKAMERASSRPEE